MLILKILILGGTAFLGPHLVEELLQRGHEVTLFTRGIQNPHLFPTVEKLQGDREGNLRALEGRYWDAVIDTSGHHQSQIEASSEILEHSTRHYTFISSISAYADFHSKFIDESYPLAVDKTYGGQKATCEQVIQRFFKNNALIIRPGLIVGPGDVTHRFSYWPWRIHEGGNVLAPDNPKQKVQFIDVRDLAKWIVDMVESQSTGVYNAAGRILTFSEFLKECHKALKKDVILTWVSEEFLLEHNVQDWSEVPLWLSKKKNMPGFFSINSNKAIEKGLSFRPISETIRDTLSWHHLNIQSAPETWLKREKEQSILKLWKEKRMS